MAGDILHHRDKSAAVSPVALELLQLARQRNCFGILLRVHQQPDQVRHFLLAGRILLKELPDQRLRVAQAIGGQQRLDVGLTHFQARVLRLGQRFQDKDRGPDLALRDQALAVAQSNLGVGGVFGVGAFKPLRGVGAGSFRHLCQLEEGGSRACFVSSLRAEFAQAQKVSFRGLQRHQALQHHQAVLLTSILAQVFKSALVGLEREFPIRGLEDLPEVDSLDAGRGRCTGPASCR